ncbi:hypothetical protein E5675_19215 [Sphingopyxis sp. PAMC25046]|nr:hypothetical protein E5675_19215 [Sphingopyxis sp. PAMC25046]
MRADRSYQPSRRLEKFIGSIAAVILSPSPSGVSGRSVPRTDLKRPGDVSPGTGLGWGPSALRGAHGPHPLQLGSKLPSLAALP